MCPLCVLTVIVLGGGSALAGGLNWAKCKLSKTENTGDGCQTLQLHSPKGVEKAAPPGNSTARPAKIY